MKICLFLSTVCFVVVSEGRVKRQAIIFGGPPPTSSSDFDCKTPDNKDGSCIRLRDCTPLYTTLRSGNAPPGFIGFLRQSVCRFINNQPTVCCEGVKAGEKLQTTTPFMIREVTTPPPTEPSTTPSTTTSTTPTTTPSTTQPTTALPVTEPPTQPSSSTPAAVGFDLLPETCGQSVQPATRIVGGRPSKKGAWPWLGALGYRKFNGDMDFLCGGALITTRHILTAAHCVHRRNDLELVRLGEHDFDFEDEVSHEDYNITSRMIHENYNSATFVNDIAILRLSNSVTFKPFISPVCLPQADFFRDNTLSGINGFVAGWGSIAFGNASSPFLKEAMLPIRTNEDCQEGYSVFRSVVIDGRRLCAGVGGDDACQGDSGGPLMIWNPGLSSYVVVGIVSVGFRCAEPEFPGIYTRVREYLDWIEDHLN